MTPAARAFHTRYYLCTALLPALVLALLFYGAAWAFGPLTPLAMLSSQRLWLLIGFGLLTFIGLSRSLAGIGFLLTSIPRTVVPPTADDTRRLWAMLGLPGDTDYAGADWERKAPAAQSASAAEAVAGDQAASKEPGLPSGITLIDLGPVYYMAAGGFYPGQLWLSTWTLRSLDAETLRCMLAHEAAHRRTRPGFAWQDLCWLVAYGVVWLAAYFKEPVLLPLGALLHSSLWLNLQTWLSRRSEAAADKSAADELGRERYARGLCRYLENFEARGSEGLLGTLFRLARLKGMGYSEAEARALLSSEQNRPHSLPKKKSGK